MWFGRSDTLNLLAGCRFQLMMADVEVFERCQAWKILTQKDQKNLPVLYRGQPQREAGLPCGRRRINLD